MPTVPGRDAAPAAFPARLRGRSHFGGAKARVQRAEPRQLTVVEGLRYAAERGADSAARYPYPLDPAVTRSVVVKRELNVAIIFVHEQPHFARPLIER
jgi:hypothetical protein